MLLLGTEAQRPGLTKKGVLSAWGGEVEFKLCGKAGGSTWEYSSPSHCKMNPQVMGSENVYPACKKSSLYENK